MWHIIDNTVKPIAMDPGASKKLSVTLVHEELMGPKFKSQTIWLHYLANIFYLKTLFAWCCWWAPEAHGHWCTAPLVPICMATTVMGLK